MIFIALTEDDPTGRPVEIRKDQISAVRELTRYNADSETRRVSEVSLLNGQTFVVREDRSAIILQLEQFLEQTLYCYDCGYYTGSGYCERHRRARTAGA